MDNTVQVGEEGTASVIYEMLEVLLMGSQEWKGLKWAEETINAENWLVTGHRHEWINKVVVSAWNETAEWRDIQGLREAVGKGVEELAGEMADWYHKAERELAACVWKQLIEEGHNDFIGKEFNFDKVAEWIEGAEEASWEMDRHFENVLERDAFLVNSRRWEIACEDIDFWL